MHEPKMNVQLRYKYAYLRFWSHARPCSIAFVYISEDRVCSGSINVVSSLNDLRRPDERIAPLIPFVPNKA